MTLKNINLEDPLNEFALPKFAVTLGLTHHSPTQGSIPDGHYLQIPLAPPANQQGSPK